MGGLQLAGLSILSRREGGVRLCGDRERSLGSSPADLPSAGPGPSGPLNSRRKSFLCTGPSATSRYLAPSHSRGSRPWTADAGGMPPRYLLADSRLEGLQAGHQCPHERWRQATTSPLSRKTVIHSERTSTCFRRVQPLPPDGWLKAMAAVLPTYTTAGRGEAMFASSQA